MALVPTFSKEEIAHKIYLANKLFEKTVINRLRYLGEECVKMSRESVGINSNAFPVLKFPDAKKDPMPLKQRLLLPHEKKKGQGQPVFGDYLDFTGNLRNSIGYFVAKDGQIIDADGNLDATAIALESINKNSKGFVLVVVAGMKYASYVESIGYNVISSSELYAINEMKEIARKLSEQLKRRR